MPQLPVVVRFSSLFVQHILELHIAFVYQVVELCLVVDFIEVERSGRAENGRLFGEVAVARIVKAV